MKISDIPLKREWLQIFEEEGIRELYPPQEEAIKKLFKGKNLVVAIPTASGKTLVGYIAILRAFKMGLKSVYIVPLRALAMEKYEELKRFERFGMRVALAIGDYDSPSGYLKHYDVVIATSEKMDSILRHDLEYAYNLGVVIVDEVHLMGEPTRGPTLEMVISKIRDVNDEAQIIALSATIKNSEEIASWLEGEHVYSEFRPVPLKLGVYFDDTLLFENGETINVPHDGINIGNLVSRSIELGGQVLIFVNRRKSAESLAEKLRRRVDKYLSKEDREALMNISKELQEEEYTIYGERLTKMIRHGVSFHHAGLSNRQRSVIERAFKGRWLKVIVATPTLAAGINLPSRTVIVRDVTRYDGFTSVYIPVMEVKQMLGRAGRPKYDKYGEGIIYARSASRAKEYMETYILGETEDIESQLSNDAALRIHVLALIASDMVNKEGELFDFFSKTFYGFKMPVKYLNKKIEHVLNFLEANEFITRKRLILATPLGKRVSDLYIDPYTAIFFKKCYSKDYDEFCILHTIACTPDIIPIRAKKSELPELLPVAYTHDLAIDEFDVDQDTFFGALKTALMIMDWTNEVSQDRLIGRYDVGPGDIHGRVEITDWLLYAFAEIGRVLKYPHVHQVEKLRLRVKYGVREELLPIVSLKGIGRVRARRLFDYGFNSIEKLRKAKVSQLTRIPGIGEKLAHEILKQARREILK
ncbi:superfamily II helicase [Aciduliprofundum sp. MAR08-339]|uniref:DEAD/DEAH box helicase n=1 Tax=Aciduliprofundum sp. (strain MAR08-339) TaxID=673860 RepID=UPI0002A4797D|nr:superfamily II helicase [Aciduliprofundum sp. MAR08-339]